LVSALDAKQPRPSLTGAVLGCGAKGTWTPDLLSARAL